MIILHKVRSTIEKHHLITRGDTVVVAVSGGPDSLTLLHALRALRKELQITLHVAHLNHNLRGAESDADAAWVAQIAREWQLPATIETRDVGAFARAEKLSIEAAARQVRYAFLAQTAQRIGARVIAVAHHADDQVETVLMHFLRGAGLAGLSGMPHKTAIGNWGLVIPSKELPITDYELLLVRPLLDVSRADIEKYCQAHALTPRADSSNLDTTLFRNKLRRQVLPYLETLNPNLRGVIRRAAHGIADDYDYLQTQVDAAFARVARQDAETGAIIFARDAWRALHPALQRGTLRAAFQKLRGDFRNLTWTHIEDARNIALEKNAGARAPLPDGLRLVVEYDTFTLADESRRILPDLPRLNVERMDLPPQGVTTLPDSEWVVETTRQDLEGLVDRWTAFFDAAKCAGEIYLRPRRAGDRFQPAGLRGHSKSLHEFMIDEKIPRAARAQLPLLVVGDAIAWVCGWRVDERVRVTEATKEIWRVTFRRQ